MSVLKNADISQQLFIDQKKAQVVIRILLICELVLILFIVVYGYFGLASLDSKIQAKTVTVEYCGRAIRSLFIATLTACGAALFATSMWLRTLVGFVKFLGSSKSL